MSGSTDPGPNTQALIDALTARVSALETMQQEIIDYLHWLGLSSNAPSSPSWILGVPTVWHP